jgi:hypothetical protein
LTTIRTNIHLIDERAGGTHSCDAEVKAYTQGQKATGIGCYFFAVSQSPASREALSQNRQNRVVSLVEIQFCDLFASQNQCSAKINMRTPEVDHATDCRAAGKSTLTRTRISCPSIGHTRSTGNPTRFMAPDSATRVLC